ncbi:MAG: hypothetical protein IJ071_05025 [Ruminococcus sp.]|nr:hypothetical protein [Ruminococcus sp.]
MMIIKIILIAAAVFVFIFVGIDLKANLDQLKASQTSSFMGIATPVTATVADKTRYDLRSGKGQGPAMANLNDIQLTYEVDGVSYTKTVGLLDRGSSLKTGDTVELMYDSSDPGRAVMADGSESASAKNGFKFDAGVVIGTVIVELIIFFVFLG